MDIKYVIDSGFITEDDMKNMTGGEGKKMSGKEICKKIRLAFKRLPFVIFFIGSLLKGVRALKVASKIPDTYDVNKINKWIKKIKKFFE